MAGGSVCAYFGSLSVALERSIVECIKHAIKVAIKSRRSSKADTTSLSSVGRCPRWKKCGVPPKAL